MTKKRRILEISGNRHKDTKSQRITNNHKVFLVTLRVLQPFWQINFPEISGNRHIPELTGCQADWDTYQQALVNVEVVIEE